MLQCATPTKNSFGKYMLNIAAGSRCKNQVWHLRSANRLQFSRRRLAAKICIIERIHSTASQFAQNLKTLCGVFASGTMTLNNLKVFARFMPWDEEFV